MTTKFSYHRDPSNPRRVMTIARQISRPMFTSRVFDFFGQQVGELMVQMVGPGFDAETLQIGYSICSPADQFTKARGRQIAEGRMHAHPIQVALTPGNSYDTKSLRGLAISTLLDHFCALGHEGTLGYRILEEESPVVHKMQWNPAFDMTFAFPGIDFGSIENRILAVMREPKPVLQGPKVGDVLTKDNAKKGVQFSTQVAGENQTWLIGDTQDGSPTAAILKADGTWGSFVRIEWFLDHGCRITKFPEQVLMSSAW